MTAKIISGILILIGTILIIVTLNWIYKGEIHFNKYKEKVGHTKTTKRNYTITRDGQPTEYWLRVLGMSMFGAILIVAGVTMTKMVLSEDNKQK